MSKVFYIQKETLKAFINRIQKKINLLELKTV